MPLTQGIRQEGARIDVDRVHIVRCRAEKLFNEGSRVCPFGAWCCFMVLETDFAIFPIASYSHVAAASGCSLRTPGKVDSGGLNLSVPENLHKRLRQRLLCVSKHSSKKRTMGLMSNSQVVYSHPL